MLDRSLLGVLLALAFLPSSSAVGHASARPRAPAQEPKLGNVWYEDKVDLGFKLKAPKDWEFVPPSPLEPNLVGKYAPPNSQYMNLGGDAVLFLNVWLVKFDRRAGTQRKEEKKSGDQTIQVGSKGSKDIHSWMSERLDEGTQWSCPDPKGEPIKGVPVKATAFLYEGMSTNGRAGAEPKPIRCYVALFELAPQVEVALVGIGPSESKWRPYQKAYETMAKSFQPVAVAGLAAGAPALEANSPRGKKRAQLELEIAKSPDWSLYETPNYFIVANNFADKQFIEELKGRLEGIRSIFEQDYPPSEARKIKTEPAAKPGASGAPGAPGEDGEPGQPSAYGGAPDDSDRTSSATDPMELSRTSVVRVCKDEDQYHQYGGPSGTGGYWLWVEEELVIYDDKEERGRDFTWGVLSHEAFHQYIFYFYGNISPHSWYNEGSGDFYYGFEYKHGKFKLGPARNRLENVQELIQQDRHLDLKDFVRWTKDQYYGSNKGNGRGGSKLEGWECYAQGWSLIWFLRTGAGKAKGWQKSWGSILDTYLDTLVESGDLEKAVDRAFEGVDWDAFQQSWLDYIG
jgi:hypothetical protein